LSLEKVLKSPVGIRTDIPMGVFLQQLCSDELLTTPPALEKFFGR
jgi:hypothetical protein